jgi:hypothetical protein
MPIELGETQLGPENAELAASRTLQTSAKIKILAVGDTPQGKIYTGKVDNRDVVLVLDPDGGIRKGNCDCSHHFKSGLRRGPCRHLLALRSAILNPMEATGAANLRPWYQRAWGGFGLSSTAKK